VAAAAARDKLQAIRTNSSKRVCSDEKYGEVALPPGVLQKVVICLAAIEADGVRGPSMAARDLANAALVSCLGPCTHGVASISNIIVHWWVPSGKRGNLPVNLSLHAGQQDTTL
jgi:hypothetical protein